MKMYSRIIYAYLLFAIPGVVVIVSVVNGCGSLSPETKQNILSAEKVACALANSFLPDEQIKTLCTIADQDLAPILNLVAAQRATLTKEHAAAVSEGKNLVGAVPCLSPGVPSVTTAAAASAIPQDSGAPKAAAVLDAGAKKK